jgi:predicted kinase
VGVVAGRLVLVCGLPGAGKTTFARRRANEIRAMRMCPDEWMLDLGIDLWHETARSRVEALQWRIARDLLRLGTSVVIEWGLWSRAERDALRSGARQLGAAVELHFLVEPTDVLWERIERRQIGQRWGARPIRRDELESWVATVEYPDATELAMFDNEAE